MLGEQNLTLPRALSLWDIPSAYMTAVAKEFVV